MSDRFDFNPFEPRYVHIDRLDVSNYGVFASENSAKFVVVDGRPINLIVADGNAFGKTTLLEAFQLALFGLRLPVSKMVEIKLAGKRESGDGASYVGVNISEGVDVPNSLKLNRYVVKRSFSYNTRIVEESSYFCQYLNSAIESESISHKLIDDLLPKQICGMVLWEGGDLNRQADDANVAAFLGHFRSSFKHGRKYDEFAKASSFGSPGSEFDDRLKEIESSITFEVRRFIGSKYGEIRAIICRESLGISLLMHSGTDVRDFLACGEAHMVRYAVRGALVKTFIPNYPVVVESPFAILDDCQRDKLIRSGFWSLRQVVLICSRSEISNISRHIVDLVSSVHLINGDRPSERSRLVPATWSELRL